MLQWEQRETPRAQLSTSCWLGGCRCEQGSPGGPGGESQPQRTQENVGRAPHSPVIGVDPAGWSTDPDMVVGL